MLDRLPLAVDHGSIWRDCNEPIWHRNIVEVRIHFVLEVDIRHPQLTQMSVVEDEGFVAAGEGQTWIIPNLPEEHIDGILLKVTVQNTEGHRRDWCQQYNE